MKGAIKGKTNELVAGENRRGSARARVSESSRENALLLVPSMRFNKRHFRCRPRSLVIVIAMEGIAKGFGKTVGKK